MIEKFKQLQITNHLALRLAGIESLKQEVRNSNYEGDKASISKDIILFASIVQQNPNMGIKAQFDLQKKLLELKGMIEKNELDDFNADDYSDLSEIRFSTDEILGRAQNHSPILHFAIEKGASVEVIKALVEDLGCKVVDLQKNGHDDNLEDLNLDSRGRDVADLANKAEDNEVKAYLLQKIKLAELKSDPLSALQKWFFPLNINTLVFGIQNTWGVKRKQIIEDMFNLCIDGFEQQSDFEDVKDYVLNKIGRENNEIFENLIKPLQEKYDVEGNAKAPKKRAGFEPLSKEEDPVTYLKNLLVINDDEVHNLANGKLRHDWATEAIAKLKTAADFEEETLEAFVSDCKANNIDPIGRAQDIITTIKQSREESSHIYTSTSSSSNSTSTTTSLLETLNEVRSWYSEGEFDEYAKNAGHETDDEKQAFALKVYNKVHEVFLRSGFDGNLREYVNIQKQLNNTDNIYVTVLGFEVPALKTTSTNSDGAGKKAENPVVDPKDKSDLPIASSFSWKYAAATALLVGVAIGAAVLWRNQSAIITFAESCRKQLLEMIKPKFTDASMRIAPLSDIFRS